MQSKCFEYFNQILERHYEEVPQLQFDLMEIKRTAI